MGWQSETSKRQVLLTVADKAIASGNPSGLFVVASGTVKWRDAANKNTHEYTLAVGYHPIAISQLMVNTTATVLGLYD